MKLNLGCGPATVNDMINVDIVKLPGVDVVQDLDQAPWPWPDSSVEYIFASHVFEHLDQPVLFMTEAWRVLASGGRLEIWVPWWLHSNSYTDPTHKRHCTERTFDYWIRGRPLHDQYGAGYGSPPAVFQALRLLLSDPRGDEPSDEFRIILEKVT